MWREESVGCIELASQQKGNVFKINPHSPTTYVLHRDNSTNNFTATAAFAKALLMGTWAGVDGGGWLNC